MADEIKRAESRKWWEKKCAKEAQGNPLLNALLREGWPEYVGQLAVQFIEAAGTSHALLKKRRTEEGKGGTSDCRL